MIILFGLIPFLIVGIVILFHELSMSAYETKMEKELLETNRKRHEAQISHYKEILAENKARVEAIKPKYTNRILDIEDAEIIEIL